MDVAELDRTIRKTDLDTALRAVARLRRLAEDLERDRVDAARAAGWSWQDIAACLGVTRQTAHRKHHRGPQARRG